MSTLSDLIKERKKVLDSLDPKDRLGYVNGCVQSLLIINQSVGGWMQLLSDPIRMSSFPHEDLKNFFEFFHKFAIDFLDFDEKVTNQEEKYSKDDTKNQLYK